MDLEKSCFLSPGEKDRLLSCIGNATDSLAEIEKKFKDSFKPTEYNAVVGELNSLYNELIVSSEGVPLVSALFLVHVMMKAGYLGAKCAFYGMLVQLDRALKKDIYDAKEKEFLSKESDENKKSLEAARSDIYRIHSSAKVFAFHLLNDSLTMEKNILDLISQKQESLDAQIEKFEQHSSVLQSAISDMFEYWKSDSELTKCSSLLESCATFGMANKKRASVALPTLRAKLPSAPVSSGELQFFLPDTQASNLIFDSKRSIIIKKNTYEYKNEEHPLSLYYCSALIVSGHMLSNSVSFFSFVTLDSEKYETALNASVSPSQPAVRYAVIKYFCHRDETSILFMVACNSSATIGSLQKELNYFFSTRLVFYSPSFIDDCLCVGVGNILSERDSVPPLVCCQEVGFCEQRLLSTEFLVVHILLSTRDITVGHVPFVLPRFSSSKSIFDYMFHMMWLSKEEWKAICEYPCCTCRSTPDSLLLADSASTNELAVIFPALENGTVVRARGTTPDGKYRSFQGIVTRRYNSHGLTLYSVRDTMHEWCDISCIHVIPLPCDIFHTISTFLYLALYVYCTG
eukprot:gene6485-4670_t